MPHKPRNIRLDSIALNQTYFTKEGYLVDHPIVTSTGIFEYHNPDGSIRRELRLPEEVFAEKSLKSYKGKPIIITHEAGYISKDNVDEEIIGTILSEGYRDGNDVRAEIIIHDTNAMKNCGVKELSLGYDLDLDETPGEWEGQPYDAVQRNISINHLALVKDARAGDQARLNIDSRDKNQILKGGKAMDEKKTTTKPADESAAAIEAFQQRRKERLEAAGESAPADESAKQAEQPVAADSDEAEAPAQEKPNTDSDEAAAPADAAAENEQDRVQLVKDRRDRRDAAGDPSDVKGAMGVIAEQDEDIDTLLGVIDALKAVEKLDADDTAGGKNCDSDGEKAPADGASANTDRKDSKDDLRELLRVVRIGDKFNIDGLEALSTKNAKKTIIKKLKPSIRLDGKSSAYVDAVFDITVEDALKRKDSNFQRQQMIRKDSKDTPARAVGSASEARQRMIDRQLNKKKEDK